MGGYGRARIKRRRPLLGAWQISLAAKTGLQADRMEGVKMGKDASNHHEAGQCCENY